MEGFWVLFWRAKKYARLNRTQNPSPIPAPERVAGAFRAAGMANFVTAPSTRTAHAAGEIAQNSH
jgi:hypothetical protein